METKLQIAMKILVRGKDKRLSLSYLINFLVPKLPRATANKNKEHFPIIKMDLHHHPQSLIIIYSSNSSKISHNLAKNLRK